jgi:hypothetical protein
LAPRWTRCVLVIVALLAVPASGDAATRGAFYYPWYPATWTVNGSHVSYHPVLGYYSSSDVAVVDRHVQWLNYARVDVAIASWFGPGSQSESTRIPLLLSRTVPPLKWALFYECEGNSPRGSSCQSGGPDPSVSAIQGDLAYANAYTSSPSYMRMNGKPLIFVWSAGDSACTVADRWKQAAPNWYVVLKLSSGFKDCSTQPDGWHQYGPSSASHHHAGYYYTISPGFRRADGAGSTLARDINRWNQQVKDMVASGEPWQLITTFNEWGEGTAVESAEEWKSASGAGQYLDALHSPSSGGGAGGNPGRLPAANAKPRLRSLSMAPRAFRAARRGPAIATVRQRAGAHRSGTAARRRRTTVRRGTTVRYRLSARAIVRFTVRRQRAGRKRARRVRGRLEHAGLAGLNSFAFRGRIGGRALRPGRYRLIAAPLDATGRAGAAKRLRFRVVRPRRR